jgi:hypothetical protein
MVFSYINNGTHSDLRSLYHMCDHERGENKSEEDEGLIL